MEAILELSKINFIELIIQICMILAGLKAVSFLFEWIFDKLGLQTKWSQSNHDEHELLISTSQKLSELQNCYNQDIKKIQNNIKNLTDMFVNKEINDYRWEIINFATDLSRGKEFNREYFDHVLRTYHKYEHILKENNMENGLVSESINFINEKYHDNLKNGMI